MNTRVHYQYRDGANYHFRGSVVVHSKMTGALWKRIRDALDHDTGGFIAHQVGLPEVFGYLSGPHIDEPARNGRAYDYDSETDHCWHSFPDADAWEVTSDDPTDTRSVMGLTRAFERARKIGWRSFDPEQRFDP